MDAFTDISLFTAPDLGLDTNYNYYSKTLKKNVDLKDL